MNEMKRLFMFPREQFAGKLIKLFCKNVAIYSGETILAKINNVYINYEIFNLKLIIFKFEILIFYLLEH